MVCQLPDGALAAAVGVQVYSYVCLICSLLMVFLVWKHRERDSYVALFSYSTIVSTVSSIAQQLHTLVAWEEVKTGQFYYVQDNLGSPELAIAGPSYGLDRLLYYFQYYCYNVQGFLTLFWAFALAFSISKPCQSTQDQCTRRKRGLVSKALALLLPGVFVSFLQLPAVRSSAAAFITLADISLATSLSLGSILVFAILAKYILSRRKIHRWTIRYPPPREAGNANGADGQGLNLQENNSIYDAWLIVRFAIALFFIEAFQLLTILYEIAQVNKNKQEALPDKPDISVTRAQLDFVAFIPGVSAGLLVFLVFGTTRNCQRTILNSFIPRRFRKGTDSVASHSTPQVGHQWTNFLTSPSLESDSDPRRCPQLNTTI
ncbi:hypothetical protein F4808DRAFT_154800 [Astrocystis sublimbata]|nr:hypothetical protein F4808DRAFT_154800 [Astrocystis sublimbata]